MSETPAPTPLRSRRPRRPAWRSAAAVGIGAVLVLTAACGHDGDGSPVETGFRPTATAGTTSSPASTANRSAGAPGVGLSEAQSHEVRHTLQRLLVDANMHSVLLFTDTGEPVAAAGDYQDLQATVAQRWVEDHGEEFLDKLEGEREASALGITEHLHLHLQRVGEGYHMLVVFDDRSSLGLVRLRAKKATVDLERALTG